MAKDFNAAAAMAWGHCGTGWEPISFGLSDAIGWAVQCLAPQPGERILDIGTGTGWAARLAARLGARVTGADLSPGMIAAARRVSSHLSDRLDFVEAAAESLPFAEAAFDGVVSTYGVIFTADPDAAIGEMARVLKPDGRLVLTTWADRPDGYIPRFFDLVGRYADAPPPPASPMDWGRIDWLEARLGRAFALSVEEVTTVLYAPDAEAVWQKYLAGFGPLTLVAEALPPERRREMEAEFKALHARFAAGGQLRITREALLVRGSRR